MRGQFKPKSRGLFGRNIQFGGWFEIAVNSTTVNSQSALFARTNGTGRALHIEQDNIASGSAGYFRTNRNANSSPTLQIDNLGSSSGGIFSNQFANNVNPALGAINAGLGWAGVFYTSNSNNTMPTLYSVTGGKGSVGLLYNANSLNTSNIFEVKSEGTGNLIRASSNSISNSNHIARFSYTGTLNPNVVVCETSGRGSALAAVNYFNSSGSSLTGWASYFSCPGANNNLTALWAANYSTNATYRPTGIIASCLEGVALLASAGNNLGGTAIYSIHLGNVGYAGHFVGDVKINGTLSAVIKNAVVKNGLGEVKAMICEESTEAWFTDYGFGQLQNGTATITFESEYTSLLASGVAYHVFIQMEGPCNNAGVYITNKTASSFQVVQQNTGNDCNAAFSYRITAKRKAFNNLRLPTLSEQRTVVNQYMASDWPEVIADAIQTENNLNANSPTIESGMPENTVPENPYSVMPSSPSPPSSPAIQNRIKKQYDENGNPIE